MIDLVMIPLMTLGIMFLFVVEFETELTPVFLFFRNMRETIELSVFWLVSDLNDRMYLFFNKD